MRIDHVILDRDGVLNVEAAGGWVTRVADWRWQEGALAALALMVQDGRTLSVATNQSCVGRGVVDAATVAAVHQHMRSESGAALAHVFCCPHHPDAGCPCRKPRPGLLLQAVAATGIAPEHTLFVGDSATDLQAARAAGVTPVLVRTGKGRATEADPSAVGVAVFDDLTSLAHSLRRGGPGAGARIGNGHP